MVGMSNYGGTFTTGIISEQKFKYFKESENKQPFDLNKMIAFERHENTIQIICHGDYFNYKFKTDKEAKKAFERLVYLVKPEAI